MLWAVRMRNVAHLSSPSRRQRVPKLKIISCPRMDCGLLCAIVTELKVAELKISSQVRLPLSHF
jgi:hypothetical protein